MSNTPATGSPRSQRLPRSARRAQLLEAAQATFAAVGYHAAAMDDIAERAGVSKPVLYQHFPGKLELYLALLDQHCATLETLVGDALGMRGEAKSRVFATVQAYFDFVAREDAAFRMVFESDLTSEPQVRNRLDAVTDSCADTIAAAIVEDTEGGLDEEQALLMAVALAGMAQVSARQWLAQGATVPKDEAARLVGRLAWRGVTGFPVGAEGAGQPHQPPRDAAAGRAGESSADAAG